MIKEELLHLEEQYEKEVTGIIDKSLQLLRSKYGLWVLGIISFIDSAVAFPGPVDPFLAAYIVAERKKAWIGFFVATFASVLGGVFLYAVSALFTEQLLQYLSVESEQVFREIVAMFDRGTFMLAFLGAFTPIPYGFVVIAVGALKGNVWMFILGSIAGRGLRFGVVAYLTYHFGERALALAMKNLKIGSIILVAAASLYILYKLYL
jgi:membrane protein YqaA with SNARE-associated domain